MTPKQKRFYAGLVAVVVLVGFAVMYVQAFYRAWTGGGSSPAFSPEFVYVGTALAGLVGGVVAMIFNERLPEDPAARPAGGTGGAAPFATHSQYGPEAGMAALVGTVSPRKKDYLSIISTAYVLGYFLTGVVAIATWVVASADTPDMVKNLALICIGLFLAIARSFFNVPNPQ